MEPLLSVVTITYNHEPYIVKCIEGVLMQKVDFPIEFIIADDCSTDGTRAICEEYTKAYPGIIRLISSENNVGAVTNENRAFIAARGKYIATCEGDDYWTDPLKLQKQVDFLEANPDYSVCFHRFKKHHKCNDMWEDDGCDNLFPDHTISGIDISMGKFMHQWCTQYLTMVFRKDCYDFEAHKQYRYYRDTHQIYHLILNGKCWLFAFEGGVYQITGNGEYSTKDSFRKNQMTLAVDKELWKVNNDKGWKEMCAVVMQYIIDNYKENRHFHSELRKYCLNLFMNNYRIDVLAKNLIKLI